MSLLKDDLKPKRKSRRPQWVNLYIIPPGGGGTNQQFSVKVILDVAYRYIIYYQFQLFYDKALQKTFRIEHDEIYSN